MERWVGVGVDEAHLDEALDLFRVAPVPQCAPEYRVGVPDAVHLLVHTGVPVGETLEGERRDEVQTSSRVQQAAALSNLNDLQGS